MMGGEVLPWRLPRHAAFATHTKLATSDAGALAAATRGPAFAAVPMRFSAASF